MRLSSVDPAFYEPTSPSRAMPARYEPPPIVTQHSERFMDLVDRPAMDQHDVETYFATCWLWRGTHFADGWPHFNAGGVKHPIHRFSHELFVARVPDGFVARPRCETRLCVAWFHLQLRPKRVGGGLSREVQDTIRALYNDTPANRRAPTQDELAARLGVSRRTVARALAATDA